MSTLSYQTIKLLCKNHALITPCVEKSRIYGMSYGLSHCGYDVRIKQGITLYPVNLTNLIINAIASSFIGKLFKVKHRHSFLLASTVEHFKLPAYIKAEVKDKSSWARLGIAVQNTILEPGWAGYLTLEITNHSDSIVEIKSCSPISQIVFENLDAVTDVPYEGKYQNQADKPVNCIYEK